ncbi:relaxase [Bosea caraganae]|uniref:Relaxase n=1 Tax=Bosea caraganae TaxID=2763117 RepID=A0A370L185_9HYPH|nr:relaxase/mobilization nuclease domain-containing protein [Bosea caraganae]RDJ21085.1 relaxase [Bosea caraganae]RDJ28584.1 relaxase [Bosea caraganae]
MILKGSQRGGSDQLAIHLLNERDNDHVESGPIVGCMARDLRGALAEMYAISRATACSQFMFSLSLSPPKGEMATVDDFQAAIQLAAERLGLADQPRAVVYHEKSARRHCHVVFSRIDAERMRAINLPFFKQRLTELSRELYLTHGWELPKGLADKSLANPLNFGLLEWQEAQRAKRDPREIKAVLKQCWAQFDNEAAFANALKDRGLWLCRGDRRGFIVQDYRGNAFSLSRWLKVGSKELKARLGSPERHPSVEQVKAEIVSVLDLSAKRSLDDLNRMHADALMPLLSEHRQMVSRQRKERLELAKLQHQRFEANSLANAERLRKGLRGLFDWVTGKRRLIQRAIKLENELVYRHRIAESEITRQRHLKESHTVRSAIDRQFLKFHESQQALQNIIFGVAANPGHQSYNNFGHNLEHDLN